MWRLSISIIASLCSTLYTLPLRITSNYARIVYNQDDATIKIIYSGDVKLMLDKKACLMTQKLLVWGVNDRSSLEPFSCTKIVACSRITIHTPLLRAHADRMVCYPTQKRCFFARNITLLQQGKKRSFELQSRGNRAILDLNRFSFSLIGKNDAHVHTHIQRI